MINNNLIQSNLNIRQRTSVTPSPDQAKADEVVVPIADSPRRSSVQALANPSRTSGWMNRVRQSWHQGQHAVRENLVPIGKGMMAIGGVGFIGSAAAKFTSASHNESPVSLPELGLLGGGLLCLAGALSTLVGKINQSELAGRPLVDVINDIRSHRASSSSASNLAFDWSQPGLLVNEKGVDVKKDFSHFLNRLLDAIRNEPEENKPASYSNLNGFLEDLEKKPEFRSKFANHVQDLNNHCLNRSAAGFNAILRELRKDYDEHMPIKDFMLFAVLEMALKEADAELVQHLKEDGVQPQAESYQALQGDVVRMLREKIPDLPKQFEFVYQDLDSESKLQVSEREELTQKVVNKVADPMECAYLLQASMKENAFLERRFASVVSKLNETLSDANREKVYADLAKKNGKDEISLEEMLQVDKELKAQRDKDVQAFYAEVIRVTTGLQ